METSYVAANIEDVKQKCENILKRVEALRADDREKQIAALMNKRFFKKTRAQAEKIVDAKGVWDGSWRDLGWRAEYDTKRLLTLCANSRDGIVYLCDADANLLKERK